MKNTLSAEEEKLCVKGLASSLGVSVRYVYEMRRCGFHMEGRSKDNQTATNRQAVDWITENDFKICDGVGYVNGERGV
jgi:hypothetical protein